MKVTFLAIIVSGASAATLRADKMVVPSGDRTPIDLSQMRAVVDAESAALPEIQTNPNEFKSSSFISLSVPEGDASLGDLTTHLDELKKLNDQAADLGFGNEAAVQGGFLEKKAETTEQAEVTAEEADNKPKKKKGKESEKKLMEKQKQKIPTVTREETQQAKRDDKEDEQVAEGKKNQEPKLAEAATKLKKQVPESAEGEDSGWDITFYVLLSVTVLVLGWWAIKVGLHERAAEAMAEFAFQCKKALSKALKGSDSHTALDERSESSYTASDGTLTSESSKGALNSHLQGVIDRVKTNLGDGNTGSSSNQK